MQNIKELIKKVIVCKSGKVKKLNKLLRDIINLDYRIDKLSYFAFDLISNYDTRFDVVKLTYMTHKLHVKRKNLLMQFETLLLNIVLINTNEKLLRALYTERFVNGLLDIKNLYNDDHTFHAIVLAFFAEYYELSKNRHAFISMCLFDDKLLQIVFKNKSIYDVIVDKVGFEAIDDRYEIEYYLYRIITSFFSKYDTQFIDYLRRTRNKSFNSLCIRCGYRVEHIPQIDDEEIPF